MALDSQYQITFSPKKVASSAGTPDSYGPPAELPAWRPNQPGSARQQAGATPSLDRGFWAYAVASGGR